MAQLIQERTFLRWKPRKTFVLVIANMSRSKYLFLELSYFNGFIKDRVLENHRIICFSVYMYYIMFISEKNVCICSFFHFLMVKKPFEPCGALLFHRVTPLCYAVAHYCPHVHITRYPFIKVRDHCKTLQSRQVPVHQGKGLSLKSTNVTVIEVNNQNIFVRVPRRSCVYTEFKITY